MDVNLAFVIPSDSVSVTSLEGLEVKVNLPLVNPQLKGVNARLLSYVWREGQVKETSIFIRLICHAVFDILK